MDKCTIQSGRTVDIHMVSQARTSGMIHSIASIKAEQEGSENVLILEVLTMTQ